jgi:hypothetical protein
VSKSAENAILKNRLSELQQVSLCALCCAVFLFLSQLLFFTQLYALRDDALLDVLLDALLQKKKKLRRS